MASQPLLNDEQIFRIFKAVDLNKNGKVSVGELLVFLRKLGLIIDEHKCFLILDQYDIAQDDDELDPAEFNQFFRASFPDKVESPLPCKGIALPQQPINMDLLFNPEKINAYTKKTHFW